MVMMMAITWACTHKMQQTSKRGIGFDVLLVHKRNTEWTFHAPQLHHLGGQILKESLVIASLVALFEVVDHVIKDFRLAFGHGNVSLDCLLGVFPASSAQGSSGGAVGSVAGAGAGCLLVDEPVGYCALWRSRAFLPKHTYKLAAASPPTIRMASMPA